MTFLAAAVALVALAVALDRSSARRHAADMAGLALERDRFEGSKPLPPHEDAVKRIAELERKVDAIMSRGGFEVVR